MSDIYEGLAESFAASLSGEGIVGYYVTDFNAQELGAARSLIRDGLDRIGFDVIRGYIFGDGLAEKLGFYKVGMPDFGGYAVGYHLVQAYLAWEGKSVKEATFIAADEIIKESGFFD